MAISIMNTLGEKMIISKDKLGTVCWTVQTHARYHLKLEGSPSPRY